MSSPRPAEGDKPPVESPDCSEKHEEPCSRSNSGDRAPICHFQQVRGTGEAEVLRLASIQHGHVHRAQLVETGVGRGALAHRLRTGWLRETFPSVYRVSGAALDRTNRAMAAALFFRGDALITGPDAASLWTLLDTTQQPSQTLPIQVLLVGRSAKPRRGITVHRVKALAKQDIRWRNGIPVTSPALTILRLAGQMGDLELETVLSAGFRKHLVRRSQLDDVMARYPGAKGIATLRGLLEQTESLHDTRSGYERKLLRLLKDADLPLPITNTWVGGVKVDGVWPDLKLVLEFDSWQWHGEREGFETDRLRDQRVLIAGHQTLRVTARQIDWRPYALVARIASIATVLAQTNGEAPTAWPIAPGPSLHQALPSPSRSRRPRSGRSSSETN